MPKRLRLLLFSILVAVVAAEGLLQLGYFVMWCSRPASAPPMQGSTDAPTILCVGDSFTYGMGATSPQRSYPAQMAAELRRDTGIEWRVENRGWPGRMSREILEGLDGWLAQTRPRFLCVAVGVNDSWRRPDELVLQDDGSPVLPVEAGERYVWTFRLARLFTAFRTHDPFRDQQVAQPAAAGTGPPRDAVVGDWVLLGLNAPVTLGPDGSGTLGTEPLQWQLDGAQLTLTTKVLPAITGACRVADDRLVLTLGGAHEVHFKRLAKGALPRNAAEDAYRLMAHADHAGAAAAFREAIADSPPASPYVISLRSGLAGALLASGKREEALSELATVRTLHAAQNDVVSAESLASCLMMLGFEDEGAEVVAAVLPSNPESANIWSMQSHIASKRGDVAAARAAIDKSLELAGKAGVKDRSYQFLTKALLYNETAAHAPVFADCVIAAQLDSGHAERTRQTLSLWRAPAEAKEPAVRAACEARGLAAETREMMLRLLREASGEGNEQWHAVLKSHLRQVIRRSRRAGCETVLGTYPFVSETRWILKSLAAEEHCAFVEIDTTFTAIRTREPQRVLTVTDGHCNDDGYGVMATEFARAIVAATKASPGPQQDGK